VCIGKVFDGSTNLFSFIRVKLSVVITNMGCNEILQSAKAACAIDEYCSIAIKGAKRPFKDCGEFVSESQIRNFVKCWIAQSKLVGNSTYTLKIPDYVYIGNWKNRKKLPTVDVYELEYGKMYIPEEIAFIRQDTHKLKQYDDVVMYMGDVRKYGVDYHEYYMFKVRDMMVVKQQRSRPDVNYLIPSLKKKKLKVGMKNLVELDKSWKC
jgi:hypothetical protein